MLHGPFKSCCSSPINNVFKFAAHCAPVTLFKALKESHRKNTIKNHRRFKFMYHFTYLSVSSISVYNIYFFYNFYFCYNIYFCLLFIYFCLWFISFTHFLHLSNALIIKIGAIKELNLVLSNSSSKLGSSQLTLLNLALASYFKLSSQLVLLLKSHTLHFIFQEMLHYFPLMIDETFIVFSNYLIDSVSGTKFCFRFILFNFL